MSTPAIICVAITGSVPTKADNPAVPVTIAEQVESTHAAYQAGAAIAHCHVRDDDGRPTSDPDRFARLMEGIRAHCPGMIVQLSTGGRSGDGRDRGGMLPLAPEMASLSVGSNNFPTRVNANDPDLVAWLAAEMRRFGITPEIEAFDVGHVFQAALLHREGVLERRPYVQFVMGVRNSMPADRALFDFCVASVRRLLGPEAPWCAAGIGRHQAEVNAWSAEAGGHLRTGLEDNIRLDRHRLAPSNAALVARAVEIAAEYDRRPATPDEARAILGLAPGPAAA
jgi:uncharacterized protein (DUF849 family)